MPVDPTIPLCTEPQIIALFYAAGGKGKSTLCAQATRYWHKKGLRSRVIGTDNGSYDPYESGIKQGYIDYMSADSWTSVAPNVLFKLLSEGWWPEDVSTPNSRLLPGYVEVRLCMFCKKNSGSRGAAQEPKCKACGKDFPAGTRLPLTRQLTSLQNIGLVIFEGITKIGDMFLSACRESRPGDKFFIAASIEGQILAQEANEILKKKADERSAADQKKMQEAIEACQRMELSLAKGSSQDHYMKAQSDSKLIVDTCKRLPVPHVIWTALEWREEIPIDPQKPQGAQKLLGLGPALPGKGLTRKCIPWFSMVGHIEEKSKVVEVAGQPKKSISERAIHFAAHSPEGTVPWEGKTNVVGMVKKLVLEDPEKANNYATLVAEIEKAKRKELP